MGVESRVIYHISELSGKDETEIMQDSRLDDDLNMDSLDLIELVLQLKGEFGIDVPDDFDDDLTVRSIIRLIEKSLIQGAI